MLNLADIQSRVDRGSASHNDIQAMLAELQRLYADPKPASELAAEAAALADAAAQDALERAQAATLAAQAEAQAAQERANAAKKVSDAAQAAAAARTAEAQASAAKDASDAILRTRPRFRQNSRINWRFDADRTSTLERSHATAYNQG